ncbi:MAG: diaminohydroxyphosphoribosylaminopyrimidine deaminase [Polaribacter sp.]
MGTNTVLADNPKLNVRSWFGKSPVRIVLDRTLRIPESASILDGSIKTIVLTEKSDQENEVKKKKQEVKDNLIFEQIDFSEKLAIQICAVLYKHNIQSLIIEGGTQILQTFINDNFWDEALVFVGDSTFKDGIKSPEIKKKYAQEYIKNDVLKRYTND